MTLIFEKDPFDAIRVLLVVRTPDFIFWEINHPFTFLLYGVVPLGLVLYLLGTPLRAKQRQAQQAKEE